MSSINMPLEFTHPFQYVSTVCQDEVKALFDWCTKEMTPFYDKNGLVAYKIPGTSNAENVVVFHDRDPDPLNNVLTKFDRTLGYTRHVNTTSWPRNDYMLGSLCHYHTDLLEAVSALRPDLGKAMRKRYTAAVADDLFASGQADRFAKIATALQKWSRDKGYVFEYGVREKPDMRRLGDWDWAVFTLDGHFMLSCYASAMAYVAREEESGLTWYAQRLDHGMLGAQEDAECEKPFAGQYYLLQHVFKPENIIIKTVGDRIVPTDSKVEKALHLVECVHTQLVEEHQIEPAVPVDIDDHNDSPAP